MRKYKNQTKQKFGKSACGDLGNGSSIHLSYGSTNFEQHTRSRFFAKTHRGKVKWTWRELSDLLHLHRRATWFK
ncbi:MAG TPA: hypothetical protein VIK53_19255 [Verrucomicrobiae bacterium]